MHCPSINHMPLSYWNRILPSPVESHAELIIPMGKDYKLVSNKTRFRRGQGTHRTEPAELTIKLPDEPNVLNESTLLRR
jgi:hypothetical protein